MAQTDNAPPLKRSQFICTACPGQENKGAFFFFADAENFREVWIKQGETHPHPGPLPEGEGEKIIVATCPQCGNPDCREPWYMANVRKCQGKQTGPVTPAGKDKCRMNSYSTGSSYASGAIPKYLPPAKPEKYAECDECQDLDECKAAVAEAMGTTRYVACHRLSELIAKYRNAHLTGDPEALRFTAADVHAKMHRVMNQCFKAIFDNGVFIESLMVSDGKVVKMENGTNEGGEKLFVNILEKKINPAINEAIKILEKMGFSLADWTLTPKSKEAKAALEGYLAGRAAEKGVPMDEFVAKHNKDMKELQAALVRGNAAIEQDEALKESRAEEQEGKEI
jgi:hypothetical protein